MIKDKDMLEISKENITLVDMGKKLISTAKSNGGYDNITLILIQF